MPKGRSHIGSTSLFRSATRYVILKMLAILGGRSHWMIREKKAASVSGMIKFLEFFSRARECDAANLAKMSMESNSFHAALALYSWD